MRTLSLPALGLLAAATIINGQQPAMNDRLAVFAAPFKGVGATASVLVGIEADGLSPGEPDSRGRPPDRLEDVELTTIVTSLRQVQASRTDRVRLPMRVLRRFDLPPGTYQLRVTATDRNNGRAGSASLDLVVPDFGRSPLSMSALILTSMRANDLTTTGDDERLTTLLEAPPSARRQFSPGDELLAYVEIYDRVLRQDIVSTRVLDDMGQTVLENAAVVASDALHNERGVYQHQDRLRLDDLNPGRYVLRIEVRSQVDPKIRVSSEIPFTLVR